MSYWNAGIQFGMTYTLCHGCNLYSLHKIPVLTRYYALLEVPGLDYWELLIELWWTLLVIYQCIVEHHWPAMFLSCFSILLSRSQLRSFTSTLPIQSAMRLIQKQKMAMIFWLVWIREMVITNILPNSFQYLDQSLLFYWLATFCWLNCWMCKLAYHFGLFPFLVWMIWAFDSIHWLVCIWNLLFTRFGMVIVEQCTQHLWDNSCRMWERSWWELYTTTRMGLSMAGTFFLSIFL